jgi:hypothetical protein
MKIFSVAICVLMMGFMADSGSAEVATFTRPLWKEIPGTYAASYDDSASVNLNSAIRRGDIVTYDLINPDRDYTRVQTNCKIRRSRAIRNGFFESSSRVNFTRAQEEWSAPENSFHKAVNSFVCKQFR